MTLAKRLKSHILIPDGRDLGLFPQLIEIALTLGGNGPRPPLQVARRTKVMLTIAITVSWLSVVMIYFMASTDRRERRF